MSAKKMIRRLMSGLLCLLVLGTAGLSTALAADKPQIDKPVTLTLDFQLEGQPVSNVPYQLYRVASISEDVKFTAVKPFDSYQVSIDDPDSAKWKTAAETLANYIARDNIQPLDSGKTGADGKLKFPVQQKSLQTGLYLVVGSVFSVGNKRYTPEPFLISLPTTDQNGSWVYDVTANAKYDSEDKPAADTSRSVVKVWSDTGYEKSRPSSVVMQLLRKGADDEQFSVFAEVTLDEANGWKYTWDKLDGSCEWKIVEKAVPTGYTVSSSQQNTTITVTNTYQPATPATPSTPSTPSSPSSPSSPSNPSNPSNPSSPSNPSNPSNPSSPSTPSSRLPNTGMLWWPVGLLASSGMLLFLIGWARSQKKESKKN